MKRKIVLAFCVTVVLLAGCSGVDEGSADNENGGLEPSVTISYTAEDTVDNPWNKKTVSVGVANNGSEELISATEMAVEYWNTEGSRYTTYPVTFEYTESAAQADILIRPVEVLTCGYSISTDTIGCAPRLHADSTVSEPAVVKVVERIPQPVARSTVKHELGHIVGLGHSAEPARLMSTDDVLTKHQRDVIANTSPQSIETQIENGINEMRSENGLAGLDGDEDLRQKARTRAEEIANDDTEGMVVYTESGMDLDCEIDLDGRLYLPSGDFDIYSISLYRFIGLGTVDYSTADYAGAPSDAAQRTVSEWDVSENIDRAEHYNRQGVGVHITEDGKFAAVRAIC